MRFTDKNADKRTQLDELLASANRTLNQVILGIHNIHLQTDVNPIFEAYYKAQNNYWDVLEQLRDAQPTETGAVLDKLDACYKELLDTGSKAVRAAQVIATTVAADAAGFALIALETQEVIETYKVIFTAPTQTIAQAQSE